MAEFNTDSDPPMKLEMALLIYASHVGGARAVTRHDIKDGEIRPGETIDTAALRTLLDGGQEAQRDTFTWRSPYVLADSATRIVWWTLPGRKKVFIDGKPKKAWFPALLWCGHRSQRSLYMWAFRGTAAPSKDTVVYRPAFGPDLNNHIHKDSSVCLGSMNPGRYRPEDWMTAFYDSNFKTAGNLPGSPYEIKTRFKKFGTVESVLAGLGSHNQAAD